ALLLFALQALLAWKTPPWQGVLACAVVKVVNPQGVVEDVEVRADTLQGRDWIISRGLKGGERVIVENAAQHAAGSSVQAVVRQPASADAPSPLAASPAGQ
ncbi:hypothetical protein K3Z86_25770, partial [Pseudomonas aeruginosa]|nr:hypothetical protein [Pseudomonas aeruginosa]